MSAARFRQRIELAALLNGPEKGSAKGAGRGGSDRIEGNLTVIELPRVGRVTRPDPGHWSIAASLEFWRDASGLVVVDGQLRGRLPLQCQRCLEDYDCEVEQSFRVALQDSVSEGRPAEEIELLDGIGDSIVPAEIIEDELLLALPMAPRHPDVSDCGVLASKSGAEEPQTGTRGETVRPFAGLAGMLPENEKLD